LVFPNDWSLPLSRLVFVDGECSDLLALEKQHLRLQHKHIIKTNANMNNAADTMANMIHELTGLGYGIGSLL
jgi:hypothetical protein